MSNQLRIAARRAFARAPGVIGYYPAFQAAGDTALIDRSGAGNNAMVGADAALSTLWTATPNRLGIPADDGSGTTAKAPSIAAATINWNKDTETLLIAGMWNGANSAMRHVVGFGGASSTAIHGINLRTLVTTGMPQLMVYNSGGTGLSGNVGATVLANGADHHVGLIIDGVAKRIHFYLDGVYDASNSGVGLDFTAAAALMTNMGALVFGGYPHTAGKQLVYASSSYAWQVAKRTGGRPANADDVMRRLARSPLQVLSSTEWPA